MHFSFNFKWAKLREGKLLGSRSIKWKTNRQKYCSQNVWKNRCSQTGKTKSQSGVNIDKFYKKKPFLKFFFSRIKKTEYIYLKTNNFDSKFLSILPLCTPVVIRGSESNPRKNKETNFFFISFLAKPFTTLQPPRGPISIPR